MFSVRYRLLVTIHEQINRIECFVSTSSTSSSLIAGPNLAIYLGVFMLWCRATVVFTGPCNPDDNNGLVGIDPFAAPPPGVNWFPGGLGAKFGFPKLGADVADDAAALSNRFISLTDPVTCVSFCGDCGCCCLFPPEDDDCVLPIEIALTFGSELGLKTPLLVFPLPNSDDWFGNARIVVIEMSGDVSVWLSSVRELEANANSAMTGEVGGGDCCSMVMILKVTCVVLPIPNAQYVHEHPSTRIICSFDWLFSNDRGQDQEWV